MNLTQTHVIIFLCAWFFTNFEPIVLLFIRLQKKISYRYREYFGYLFCFKCVTFWSLLILSGDLWVALLFSFIASWYDRTN